MPRLLPSDDKIVVIEMNLAQDKTPGGIIVPDRLKDKYAVPVGQIVEVGPTANSRGSAEETHYSIGDAVLYPRTVPHMIDLTPLDEKIVLFILKAEDILAKVDLGGDTVKGEEKT